MRVKQIIDLTQSSLGPNNNPAFPESRNELCLSYERDGWMGEYVCAATHCGTHADAPAHRLAGGAAIGEIPLERFQGEALVVGLYHKEAGSEITRGDLSSYDVRPGDIVLLCTGWGEKKEQNAREYLEDSPWLGEGAARWLAERGVNAVGIDHFSIGGASHAEAPHEILLGAGVLIFEELLLPRALLRRDRWYLAAFPMKNGARSGSFLRAVAMEFEE